MKDTVVAIAIVVVLVVGFWWPRGAGDMPGGVNDPAREQLEGVDWTGDRAGVPEDTRTASGRSNDRRRDAVKRPNVQAPAVRSVLAAGLLTLVLALAGCGGSSSGASHSSSASSEAQFRA